jgi:hypothetical protein
MTVLEDISWICQTSCQTSISQPSQEPFPCSHERPLQVDLWQLRAHTQRNHRSGLLRSDYGSRRWQEFHHTVMLQGFIQDIPGLSNPGDLKPAPPSTVQLTNSKRWRRRFWLRSEEMKDFCHGLVVQHSPDNCRAPLARNPFFAASDRHYLFFMPSDAGAIRAPGHVKRCCRIGDPATISQQVDCRIIANCVRRPRTAENLVHSS